MARERYLLYAKEEELKRPEQKPLTPKEKRQNFWHYYKFHILIALGAIIAIIYFIYSVATRVYPDYQVVVITETYYPEAYYQGLEDVLVAAADDINGDGHIVVELGSYTLPRQHTAGELNGASDSSSMVQGIDPTMGAGQMKFVADYTAGMYTIYITDDGVFQYMLSNGMLADFEGSFAPTNAVDTSNIRVPMSQCEVFDEFLAEMEGLPELGLTLRPLKGTTMEDSEKSVKEWNDSRAFFQKLTGK